MADGGHVSAHSVSYGNVHILYDAAAVPAVTPQHFSPEWWQARGEVVGSAPGRASVHFVRAPQGVWALRHYCRGGLASGLQDRYVWTGLERSRPWREWRLTAALHAQGLPVARPIAARVERVGAFYRGDLITARIDAAEPLADLLQARAAPEIEWQQLGVMLRRFHRAGVRHDDINARNVLLDASGRFYLIDFDKAHLGGDGPWRARNLARFRRSLDKFAGRMPGFHFDAGAWRALEHGYGPSAVGDRR